MHSLWILYRCYRPPCGLCIWGSQAVAVLSDWQPLIMVRGLPSLATNLPEISLGQTMVN